MAVTLRTATEDDIPEIVRVGRIMHFESRYSRMDYNPEKVADLLRTIIPQGLTFMAEDEGETVGMFLGFATEHFFGNDLASYDLVAYTLPERRGRIGVLLIREYVRRAKALNVKDICIGVTTGIDSERTSRFYEKLGFSRVGGSFVMEN